uniref:C2H2-type domain-containing protein n=1 Tax=Sipha flava TaxID=143950 RepID=A0A2S2QY04_9HEMI
MQTIGKTTDKMDFPKTWTDILLKSISGKTNYTIDVKIGTKRIATDNQDQRESPKKRRKQSNPTRISANEENLNNGLDTDLLRSDRTKHELEHIEPLKDLTLSNDQQTSSLPLNLTTCENQKPSSDDFQQVQYSNNIYRQNNSSTKISENLNLPYQSYMQSISCFEKKDCYSVEPFKSPQCNLAANAGQAPVQIFNPEAFCDQCNKEFCNKYFLKTHKANKHGVYTENVSSGFTTDQIERYKEPPAASDFSPHANDVSAVVSTSTLFKNTLVYPQPPANTNTNASRNAMMNNQTRAFCNVCQKEFCNKYFVKRHKAKIHGIVDDGDYRTAIDDGPSSNNCKTSVRIKNEFLDFGGVADAFGKDEENVGPFTFCAQESYSRASIAQSHTSAAADTGEPEPSRSAAVPCVHIKTEGSDEEHGANGPADGWYNGHDNRHGVGVRRTGGGAEAVDLMATNDGERGTDGTDDDADRGAGAPDGATELTDKSGPMTLNDWFFRPNGGAPETTSKCDACDAMVDGSLKAHVLDKHEHLANELMNDASECEWTAAKGAGDASTSSSKNSVENYDVCATRHGGERKPSAAALSSFCRICNKELCNKYFMKTHMQRMHGISIQNGNHIGGVVCDICNKELCSKYFLRVHKLNSHGVGAAENCPRYWPDSDQNREGATPPVEGPPQPPPQQPQPPVDGPLDDAAQRPDDDGHYRYYKHYTESCSMCSRRFRSSKWLSAHLLNDHGDEGRALWRRHVNNRPEAADEWTVDDAKQYRCSYCPFATSVLSFLFVHEKFHVAEPAQRSPDRALDTNGNDLLRYAAAAKAAVGWPSDDRHHRVDGAESGGGHEPFIMQSFFLENCSVSPSVRTDATGRSDSFHSSLVYLPVKEKLTSTVNVFFKLTPT